MKRRAGTGRPGAAATPRGESALEGNRQGGAAAFDVTRVHRGAAEAAGPREKAVLVAVEFTAERGRITASARQARSSSQLLARAGDGGEEHDLGGEDQPSGSAGVASSATALRGESAKQPAERNGSDSRNSSAARVEAASVSLDFSASLAEFQELAESAGAGVVATILQRRPRPDAATLVGSGKIEEIEAAVASTSADVVLFDHDLTPSQMRNLEARLPCRVIDRTQLILDIFARHARTREGQLQVELAQLEYQLPRLAGKGKSMSQLGGGIGTRGPGETRLETDRRRINARIDHVKEQLEAVRRIRRQQRQRREAVPVPVVALVGYTNAGKSTLFNTLTAAGVLESARMFATLDPKLKQMQLPSRRKVLLSDTVGFIRNLPHTLVTSFRATLEEVERAEVLLQVQDASSPLMEEQRSEVEKVLGELDVAGKPSIAVLNKADLLDAEQRDRLSCGPRAVAVSGLTGEGMAALLDAIDAALEEDPLVERRFRVPQSEGGVLAALEAGAVVSGQRFEGNLAYLSVVGPVSLLERFRRFQERAEG